MDTALPKITPPVRAPPVHTMCDEPGEGGKEEDTSMVSQSLENAPSTWWTGNGTGIRTAILLLFFLSGATGLVYEVAWMRMLTLVFGATSFATATILSSFFTGLALGSFLFGRVADRARNLLRTYALLEAGVGIAAFLMPVALGGLTEFYVWLSHRIDIGYYQFSLIRFALSFLVLLPPAILLGGTLPVMVRFFVRRRETLGRYVGHLYGLNTLGAVVGAVAAGFFLILFLGLHEATYAAGGLNLLIAALALLLARRVEAASPPGGDPVPEEGSGGVAGPSPQTVRLALWAAGVSGFCALALEVLWTRSLVYFLDNSTHAFTTILAAFLLGIGLGSLLVARFVDGRRHLLFLLGTVQILIGLSALLAIPVLGILTPTVERMADGITGPLLTWRWIGARFLTSLAVMLIPTVLMGVAFPLVTRIYAGGVARIGTALGNVYSVNTVGGVFGSFAAGFVLIPLLGLNDAIVFAAVLSAGIGSLVLYSEREVAPGIRRASVLVAAVAVLGPGTYLLLRRAPPLASYYERMETSEILSYEEGLGATVKVFRDARGDKLLSIDGFPVAGTTLGMHDAQQSLAQIPLLLTRVSSPTVNIVGFGTGGTSWGILQHGVTRIDCVELVPGVIRAAPLFPEVNHGVLEHPDFRVILGDGRNYALMARETYDVISIDATSPKMAGNGSLYALEFYRLLRARLSREGLAVQWLPIHLLSDSEVRMTARTFQTVFPHSTLWLSPLRRHGVLVGSVQPVEIDFSSIQRKLEKDGVREELARFNVRDAYDFLSWFVMGEESLAEYVEGALLNTDRHPYLEFSPARAFFQAGEFQVRNLARLRDHRESVLPLLTNLGETRAAVDSVSERIQRRFAATQHSIAGDIFLSLGRRGEARIEYNRARAIDPDDKNWMNPAWGAQPPAGDPGGTP